MTWLAASAACFVSILLGFAYGFALGRTAGAEQRRIMAARIDSLRAELRVAGNKEPR